MQHVHNHAVQVMGNSSRKDEILYHHLLHIRGLLEFVDTLMPRLQLQSQDRSARVARSAIYFHDLGYFTSPFGKPFTPDHEERSQAELKTWNEASKEFAEIELQGALYLIEQTEFTFLKNGFAESVEKSNAALQALAEFKKEAMVSPALREFVAKYFPAADLQNQSDRQFIHDMIWLGKAIAVADVYGQELEHAHLLAGLQAEFARDQKLGNTKAMPAANAWDFLGESAVFYSDIAVPNRLQAVLEGSFGIQKAIKSTNLPQKSQAQIAILERIRDAWKSLQADSKNETARAELIQFVEAGEAFGSIHPAVFEQLREELNAFPSVSESVALATARSELRNLNLEAIAEIRGTESTNEDRLIKIVVAAGRYFAAEKQKKATRNKVSQLWQWIKMQSALYVIRRNGYAHLLNPSDVYKKGIITEYERYIAASNPGMREPLLTFESLIKFLDIAFGNNPITYKKREAYRKLIATIAPDSSRRSEMRRDELAPPNKLDTLAKPMVMGFFGFLLALGLGTTAPTWSSVWIPFAVQMLLIPAGLVQLSAALLFAVSYFALGREGREEGSDAEYYSGFLTLAYSFFTGASFYAFLSIEKMIKASPALLQQLYGISRSEMRTAVHASWSDMITALRRNYDPELPAEFAGVFDRGDGKSWKQQARAITLAEIRDLFSGGTLAAQHAYNDDATQHAGNYHNHPDAPGTMPNMPSPSDLLMWVYHGTDQNVILAPAHTIVLKNKSGIEKEKTFFLRGAIMRIFSILFQTPEQQTILQFIQKKEKENQSAPFMMVSTVVFASLLRLFNSDFSQRYGSVLFQDVWKQLSANLGFDVQVINHQEDGFFTDSDVENTAAIDIGDLDKKNYELFLRSPVYAYQILAESTLDYLFGAVKPRDLESVMQDIQELVMLIAGEHKEVAAHILEIGLARVDARLAAEGQAARSETRASLQSLQELRLKTSRSEMRQAGRFTVAEGGSAQFAERRTDEQLFGKLNLDTQETYRDLIELGIRAKNDSSVVERLARILKEEAGVAQRNAAMVLVYMMPRKVSAKVLDSFFGPDEILPNFENVSQDITDREGEKFEVVMGWGQSGLGLLARAGETTKVRQFDHQAPTEGWSERLEVEVNALGAAEANIQSRAVGFLQLELAPLARSGLQSKDNHRLSAHELALWLKHFRVSYVATHPDFRKRDIPKKLVHALAQALPAGTLIDHYNIGQDETKAAFSMPIK